MNNIILFFRSLQGQHPYLQVIHGIYTFAVDMQISVPHFESSSTHQSGKEDLKLVIADVEKRPVNTRESG